MTAAGKLVAMSAQTVQPTLSGTRRESQARFRGRLALVAGAMDARRVLRSGSRSKEPDPVAPPAPPPSEGPPLPAQGMPAPVSRRPTPGAAPQSGNHGGREGQARRRPRPTSPAPPPGRTPAEPRPPVHDQARPVPHTRRDHLQASTGRRAGLPQPSATPRRAGRYAGTAGPDTKGERSGGQPPPIGDEPRSAKWTARRVGDRRGPRR